MPEVLFDPRQLVNGIHIVTIRYEGRGCQVFMNEDSARSVAYVLGTSLTMCKPGTTIPADT